MSDAIKATLDLMQAPAEQIKVRSSYNVAAISLSPTKMVESIKKQIPEFSATYKPDFRQKIADSWPDSIDDSVARNDWGWAPSYDLDKMTNDILQNLPSLLSDFDEA